MTYQTQQLTSEFEKQSQYIVCLLAELQQKDSIILSLEAELQHCKQEFEPFKPQRENLENKMTFEGNGQQKRTFGLHHTEEKHVTVTCNNNVLTTIGANETEFSQGRATADRAADLPTLQHDHQPLQKEISDLNNSVDDHQGTHTENKLQEKHQDKLQNQSSISALPCLAEPRSSPQALDITVKKDLEIERNCEQEQGDLEREDEGIEGELKAACEPEINRLQEQVCNLFLLNESFTLHGPAFVIF